MDFNYETSRLKLNMKSNAPIVPLKLGIISDPPVLVLVYEFNTIRVHHPYSRKSGTRRKRRMPLRKFTDKTDIERYLFTFLQRHNDYLVAVPKLVLEKMLRIVQEIQKGLSVADAVIKVDKQYEINPEEDMNKLSIDELEKRKEVMSETFLKNCVVPGDKDFIYDKEVEFDVEVVKPNDWDENEENLIEIKKSESEEKVSEKVTYDINDTTSPKSPIPKLSDEMDELITDSDHDFEIKMSTTKFNFNDRESRIHDVNVWDTKQVEKCSSEEAREVEELRLEDLRRAEQQKMESQILEIITPNKVISECGDGIQLGETGGSKLFNEFSEIDSGPSGLKANVKPKKRVTFQSEADKKYVIADENTDEDEDLAINSSELNDNPVEDEDDESDISLASMDLNNAFGQSSSKQVQSKNGNVSNENVNENRKIATKQDFKQNTEESSTSLNLFRSTQKIKQVPKEFEDVGWSVVSEPNPKHSDDLSEVMEELENDSMLDDSQSQSSLTNKRMPKVPELSLSKEYDFKLDNLDDDENDEEFWK